MMKKIALSMIAIGVASFLHAQSPTTISGSIANAKSDSVKIVVYLDDVTFTRNIYKVPLINGHFEKTLTIDQPRFISVIDSTNYMSGLLDMGDDVSLYYDAADVKNTLRFSGKGKEKFEYTKSIFDQELNKKFSAQTPVAITKKYPFDHLFDYADSVENVYRKKLETIRPLMSQQSFRILSADLTGNMISKKNFAVTTVHHETAEQTLEKRQDELTPRARAVFKDLSILIDSLSFSPAYLNAVYTMLNRQYESLKMEGKAGKNLLEKYDHYAQLLTPNLKVPVMTMFLEDDMHKLNQAEDIEILIRRIYTSPADSVYKKYIVKRYNDITSFKTGMSAPDFVLQNEKGEKVTLATFKGKVVFLDFWFEKCGPCHALFQSIEPVKEKYKNENVVFLTVSIDPKNVWLESLKKNKIPGYHVFTEGREGDHPIIKSYKVAGYPTTCLIDKEGKIAMATPSNNPDELSKQIAATLSK